MKIRRNEFIIILIALVSFALAWYVYPKLPAEVASHWNFRNQVDGYMSRFWGAFILPIVSAATVILFLLIPRIDPKRKNIEKFRSTFEHFIILIQLFLFYLYALTLFWNFGYHFNMGQLLIPAFAILFYFSGNLIAAAEPNWTIGIRTPWTLTNEEVWKKTHILGGKLFKIAAVISLIGLIFPTYALTFVIIPIIIASIYSFVYSYLEYEKIIKLGGKNDTSAQ